MKRLRVLILANHGKPGVTAALRKIRRWLDECTQVVAEPMIRQLTATAAEQLPEADLGLVFGGDGTMLQQARLFAGRRLPLLGINFGKLGFLAEFTVDELVGYWPRIAAGKIPLSDRMMFRVLVRRADGSLGKAITDDNLIAMNEAVLVSGSPHRMMDMELGIRPPQGASTVVGFRGDGAIVATPTGSTAYNLGAGGPIVHPALDAFCFTPTCTNSLNFRPVIVGADHTVSLTIKRAQAPASLVLDGQVSLDLHKGDTVEAQRATTSLRLICHPYATYWQMLSRKMHWIARPRSHWSPVHSTTDSCQNKQGSGSCT
ncbi:MAG: NAD(+)/NADH kinase [Phycisphaeraceae bacterium]